MFSVAELFTTGIPAGAWLPLDDPPPGIAVDPEKVQAGVIGLVFFLVMGIAVVLLVLSMRKHLNRVDVTKHPKEQAARAAASSPIEPSPTVPKPSTPEAPAAAQKSATATAPPASAPRPQAPPAPAPGDAQKRRPKGKKR